MTTNTKTEIEESLEKVKARISTLENNEATEEYNDFLDDTNETVKVCGMLYNPSTVLEEVDPIAYRCGYSDWCDEELNNLHQEQQDLEQELKELEEEATL
jgi:hypothetical protein